jgi:hypothetical protein
MASELYLKDYHFFGDAHKKIVSDRVHHRFENTGVVAALFSNFPPPDNRAAATVLIAPPRAKSSIYRLSDAYVAMLR